MRDWLPLIAVIFVYDLLRGVADGLGFPPQESPQIRAEEWLFGKPVPTVRLQEHFWHGAAHLQWWDYAAWFLHVTHFFVTFIALAVIWVFALMSPRSIRFASETSWSAVSRETFPISRR